MRPVLYEFRKSVGSRTVIIFSIMVIAISAFGVIPLQEAQNSTLPYMHPQSDYAYYQNNSTYNIINYVYNKYGDPISGINFTISVNGSNYSFLSNKLGFANISLKGLNLNRYYLATENYSIDNALYSHNFELNSLLLTSNAGEYQISKVICKAHPYLFDIHVFYIGKNGSASPDAVLSYHNIPSDKSSIDSIAEVHTINITGSYVDNIVPEVSLDQRNSTFNVSVLGHPSSNLLKSVNMRLSTFVSPDQLKLLFVETENLVYSFAVPFLSIFLAYVVFGRLVTTEIIDSIASKPTTKTRVFIGRYLGSLVPSSLSILLGVLILCFFSDILFGESLSLFFVLSTVWIIFVEFSSFLSFSFFASAFIRSETGLIGVMTATYLILVLFWQSIVNFILYSIHIPYGSQSYIPSLIISNVINPAQYLTIFTTLLTGRVISSNINPNSFGLNNITFISIGIFWIAFLPAVTYMSMRKSQ